jgi:ketosteroid isomerase-like protein
MSENLDLVRSIFADWERGDYRSAEWADPEIEFVIADGPEPGTWTGLAGMAEANRVWLSAWEGFRVQVDEYRALDDARILVLVRVYGRGKTSGVELGQLSTTGANLLHFANGKVARWVRYFEGDRALSDLGLEE